MPLRRSIRDWDNAYANIPNIPDGAAFPERWLDAAAAHRARLGKRFSGGLAYGDHARQRFDLMVPEGPARGLCVFIHGGYWMRFDRGHFSHLSAGPLAHGYAVAMPSYRLCPEVRIRDIVADAASAMAAAAASVEGPILLAGHSAGGHLATRLVCDDTVLDRVVTKRIAHLLSISGVHDLRPLCNLSLNETLRLDEGEAEAESPALKRPLADLKVTCWAGLSERGEFLRQNALLANLWTGLGAATAVVEEPDRHHFDVIDGLADPDHPLCKMLTGEI